MAWTGLESCPKKYTVYRAGHDQIYLKYDNLGTRAKVLEAMFTKIRPWSPIIAPSLALVGLCRRNSLSWYKLGNSWARVGALLPVLLATQGFLGISALNVKQQLFSRWTSDRKWRICKCWCNPLSSALERSMMIRVAVDKGFRGEEPEMWRRMSWWVRTTAIIQEIIKFCFSVPQFREASSACASHGLWFWCLSLSFISAVTEWPVDIAIATSTSLSFCSAVNSLSILSVCYKSETHITLIEIHEYEPFQKKQVYNN